VTLTDDRQETEIAVESVPRAPVAAPTRAPMRRRVIAITTIAVGIALVCGALFLLFEGPFANAWYSTRQHALTSDFNALHEHTGAGHAIAILQIPRLNMNFVVAEGDSPQQLRGGPGHRIGTAKIGSLGNAVIMGHAHDWGGPFSKLHELKKGDLIAIQTYAPDSSLVTGVYSVVSTEDVASGDLSPFARAKDFRVTLITGRGGRYSNDRLAVTAVSGKPARAEEDVPAGTVAETPAGSSLLNASTLLAVVGLVGAVLAFVFLRRRYSAFACSAVILPLFVIGLIGVLFDVDLLLSSVR
jgi:LPXTG-site transpeptidase (sortase) family protein